MPVRLNKSGKQAENLDMPRHLTRIVATVGPASNSPEMLTSLIKAGVDIFRLNFSHGTREQHAEVYASIRKIAKEKNSSVAILQDVPGPKLRIHTFENDEVELEEGQTFRLDIRVKQGDKSQVGFQDDGWLESVKKGHRVLFGDGDVQLKVKKADANGLDCEVLAGGIVRSRQGMNFPDTNLDLGAVTEKDWKDIEFGLELGVDFIALSFVQGPDDLIAVKRYIQVRQDAPKLIAKIELPHAVNRIEAILERADGIMVARGDLGITLPIERIPVVQKRLIRLAREAGKFVITATQMLESMTTSPRPTRAEATDVANAVYDGTDGVMLSGETAVGAHPLAVVQIMSRILTETEPEVSLPRIEKIDHTIDGAMSSAVKSLVDELEARAILVPLSRGSTAQRLSRQRMGVPIIVGVPNETLARKLLAFSGVFPVLVPSDNSLFQNTKHVLAVAERYGWVEKGDVVLSSGGFPLEQHGNTNFVRALVVGGEI
ncbi:pyruvate kinase [bacterium]|nr:pyruvate kinase [bacterium]